MIREIIKSEVHKQGLTFYKLAQLSELQRTQLNNYLTGKYDLTGENIEKLLKALKLKIVSCA